MSDCISRQEAIKYIENIQNLEDYYHGKRAKHRFSLERIICVLNDVPSVTPTERTGHWISVSERLPEQQVKTYWICTDCGYQCECRWTNVNHFWTELTTDWHWHFMDVPQYQKVVAWMPLPKPYDPQESEDKE